MAVEAPKPPGQAGCRRGRVEREPPKSEVVPVTTATTFTLLLVSLKVLAASVAAGYWILNIVRETIVLVRNPWDSDDNNRDVYA